jgi:hypothetical protein
MQNSEKLCNTNKHIKLKLVLNPNGSMFMHHCGVLYCSDLRIAKWMKKEAKFIILARAIGNQSLPNINCSAAR